MIQVRYKHDLVLVSPPIYPYVGTIGGQSSGFAENIAFILWEIIKVYGGLTYRINL
jgi:hypothetical protein